MGLHTERVSQVKRQMEASKVNLCWCVRTHLLDNFIVFFQIKIVLNNKASTQKNTLSNFINAAINYFIKTVLNNFP